jgi:hypothetical protein
MSRLAQVTLPVAEWLHKCGVVSLLSMVWYGVTLRYDPFYLDYVSTYIDVALMQIITRCQSYHGLPQSGCKLLQMLKNSI